MLGAIYAALAALTFAMNNTAMRRGVLTGSVTQAMALTVPLGGLGFLIMAAVSGQLSSLSSFPLIAVSWLVAQGCLHFLVGRYFNYQANKLVGVNISAPVVQLQVLVTMLLAVVLMKEPFTVLQLSGTILMLAGSFATQLHSTFGKRIGRSEKAVAVEAAPPSDKPAFKPQYLPGFLTALGAATCYGISPIMIRMAFESMPVKSPLAGGVIAYTAATIVLCFLILPSASIRKDVLSLNRNNAMWFIGSAILVAMSQGFVYASLAIAPLMVVTPILQLSLVFRLFLSQIINREHEVLNTAVVVGALVTIVGSVIVSLDTNYVLSLLDLTGGVADVLRFRLD
ncbi:EamA family transporter [Bradyrhizobium sp. SYSU BS000235]|uniref:EamA family transporter n=1 Tax=Bradyrhizobium sp. SYSU BS000235 TaxID=3411332 RepID=UPI003C785C25